MVALIMLHNKVEASFTYSFFFIHHLYVKFFKTEPENINEILNQSFWLNIRTLIIIIYMSQTVEIHTLKIS